MKHTLKTFLLAFVAMMVPIVGWGQTNVSTSYLPSTTAIPDGSFAYTVVGVDGDYLDLKQIEGTQIPAGAPVILAESVLPNSGVANASASEYLLGTPVDQSVTIETGYSYFQLNVEDAIWYKVTGDSFINEAFKAYLKFPDVMVAGKEKLCTIKEDAPQNSCGENLTWSLTDGELVIEGTGVMYDFEAGTAPWYSYKDEIVKLTIKSGVTSVGSYAFNECGKIADVVIPNGVTSLGTHAFGYCDGLTVVSLPPSVKTIGWSAFYTCQNLKTVNLSEGVTRIGEYSFADCRKLSVFNIPEGVTEIGQWAFRNCSFTSLILPSTLAVIQSNAFFDCNKLTSLTCLATTPPELWGEAFATLSVPIYAPSGSLDAYKSKNQWKAFTILPICSSESDHNFVNGICTKCGAYEPAVDSNSDGYYEIGNAGQLYWFAKNNNRTRNAVLTADIDLENRSWTPIAYFNEVVDPYVDLNYYGVFDGNYHTIKNLNVHITDGSEAGLFSRMSNGTLKNLGIINATVQSDPVGGKSSRAGVIGGEINSSTITNVFSSGNISIITDHHQKGGIAGECNYSYMNNCYTTYGALTATNVRVATNCFYLADEVNTSSAGTAVTATQMASGEVAYNLGNAFGQTIGTDAYPVFGGAKVNYGYLSCTATEKSYSNDELLEVASHSYIDGVCEHCSDVTEARWGESLANLTHAGTMKEAFAAAMSGTASYILMQKDVAGMTTNSNPSFSITGGDFTLDLNGCSLAFDYYGPSVNGGANWVITDSSANKDGELIGTFGNLNVSDATVTITEGTVRDGLMLVHNGGKLNILGGTIATNAIRTYEGAVATISGGTLTKKLLYYSGGKFDFSTYTDLPEIRVRYELEVPTVIGSETILLPDDCGIFDEDGVFTEILSGDLSYYTIAKLPTTWYTVDFDANGGAGEMEDANANGKYRLPECTFTAPEGKMFKAWLVNGMEYQPNAVITVTENTTITAVWETPYTLAFSANGGVGSLVAVKTLNTVTLPECPFLAPEGKEFKAWLIGENEYAAGSVAMLTENAVAYAIWRYENSGPLCIDLRREGYGIGDVIYGESSLTIKKDGVFFAEVSCETLSHIMRDFDYEPNAEYTFYWDFGPWGGEEDFRIEIRLGDTRLYFGHSHELRDYYDEPFLIIPRKTQVTTVETLNIIDGELPEYLVLREAEVGTVTYTRTLPNQEWNALYLPFEIPVSELIDNYDVAYFNNMHAYDTDNSGTIDLMDMEIILIKEGTLYANHPYFVRAKSEGAKEMQLVLSDVTIVPTEANKLTCSSVYTRFDLSGTYNRIWGTDFPTMDGDMHYAISADGDWAPIATDSYLNPFRMYLTMTQLAGSPVKVDPMPSIRIRLQGEGNTTGLVDIFNNTQQTEAVYDLSGRRVMAPQKGNIYIVGGKKVIY